jgi:GDP-L-fucose synthase
MVISLTPLKELCGLKKSENCKIKIYVAGHLGLVGSALVRHIENLTNHSWVGADRRTLNLLDESGVKSFLEQEKPDAVIVAAAKVGGIGANSKFPVEFLSENLRIQLNILEACHAVDVPRVLFLGSSCIYPKMAPVPIVEDSLLTGELEPTNDAYAIAKIAGLRLIRAYSEEYGHDWISAMPTNIYGPRDNFDLNSSHVVPALVRKFHDGRQLGHEFVTLWGNGSAMREFLYSDDLASACLYLLENYHAPDHVNVGTGLDISIRDLAEKIKDIVGFKGEILWDETMPNGTPRKLLDTTKLTKLGWSPSVQLDAGLAATYQWYQQNAEKWYRNN